MLRRVVLALTMLLGATQVSLAQGNDPSFTLVNNTGRNIIEVYASPSSQDDWGRDRLGDDVVAAGRTYAIRLPRGECTYDIRVVVQGSDAEERRGINLCRRNEVVFGNQSASSGGSGKGGAPAGVGRRGNPSFNVVNRGSQAIREVYASPSTDNDWGPDRLGDEMVQPGKFFAVRLVAGECRYDVRIVYENGRSEERRGVDLCAVSSLPFPRNNND
ncbi:hypothetical protein IAI18_08010 [Acetobacteraceae bacterium H6797]|nr:hypothetical protein [Acetobacteraceae bacterium H6797]